MYIVSIWLGEGLFLYCRKLIPSCALWILTHSAFSGKLTIDFSPLFLAYLTIPSQLDFHLDFLNMFYYFLLKGNLKLDLYSSFQLPPHVLCFPLHPVFAQSDLSDPSAFSNCSFFYTQTQIILFLMPK